ncbi:MAG: PQQ-binding-like beta-propeller repeat protein, partial [Acidimicrobiia bacterium]
MRFRLLPAVIVVALLASSCGGTVGSNDWSLVGMTPDQRHLLVTTLFGGVASGCTRWEGWEVDEAAQRVDIRARLWQKRFPSACTAEGLIKTIEVELGEPMGDRALVGCGSEVCLGLEPQTWVDPWALDVVTSPEGVMVADAGMLWSFGDDGTALWNHHSRIAQLIQTPFDVVVGYDGQTTTAYDPQTGARIWSANGFIAAADDQTVYVCSSDDSEILAAIDPGSGGERWQANLPCEFVVPHDDVIAI